MNRRAEDDYPTGAPPPYVPVDPFRPSIAYSLGNVLPQRHTHSNRTAESGPLHVTPLHARPLGPPRLQARYRYGPYPHRPTTAHQPQYPYYPRPTDMSAPERERWAPMREVPMNSPRTDGVSRPPQPRRRSWSPGRETGGTELQDQTAEASHPTFSNLHGERPVFLARTSRSSRSRSPCSPISRTEAASRFPAMPASIVPSSWIPDRRPTIIASPKPITDTEVVPTPVQAPPSVPVTIHQQPTIIIVQPHTAQGSEDILTPEPTSLPSAIQPAQPQQDLVQVPIVLADYRRRESRSGSRGRSGSRSRSRSRSPRRRRSPFYYRSDSRGASHLYDYPPMPTPSPITTDRRQHRMSQGPYFYPEPVAWGSAPSVAYENVTPPPDEYIPTMHLDSAIRLPPAHELNPSPAPEEQPASSHVENASAKAYIAAFVLDTLPRQIYLHMLLRLPSLYFSRVTRIFEEAEMSMPMIKQGILDAARAKDEAMYYPPGMPVPLGMNESGQILGEKGFDPSGFPATIPSSQPYLPWAYLEPPPESVAYAHLQESWETFVDSLQKEWKTLNIISVLLLSAILTIIQIPAAAADPLTRYAALLSMICALMSLLYGCIYIIRFGTMRKTYKGAEWADEAQRTRTGIFWNVWVLLAMPATWLAWSMILYIITILSFVWRTTPVSDPNSVDETPTQILVPRIIISSVVALGVVYFILIAATLRRYGDVMDRAWQRRISQWLSDDVGVSAVNGGGDNVPAFAPNAFDERGKERQPEFKSVASSNYPSGLALVNSPGVDSIPEPRRPIVIWPDPYPPPSFIVAADSLPSTRSIDTDSSRQAAVVNEIARALVGTPQPATLPEGGVLRDPTRSVISRSELPLQESRSAEQEGPSSTLPDHNKAEMNEVLQLSAPEARSSSDRQPLLDDNAALVPVASSSSLPSDGGALQQNVGPYRSADLVTDGDEAGIGDPAKIVKLFSLSSADSALDVMSEQDLADCGIDVKGLAPGEFDKFRTELCSTAHPKLDSNVEELLSCVTPFLNGLNQNLRILEIDGRVALCREYTPSSPPPTEYAVYYFAHFNPLSSEGLARGQGSMLQRYGSIADGLEKLEVLALDNARSNRPLKTVISLVPSHLGAQDLRLATEHM